MKPRGRPVGRPLYATSGGVRASDGQCAGFASAHRLHKNASPV